MWPHLVMNGEKITIDAATTRLLGGVCAKCKKLTSSEPAAVAASASGRTPIPTPNRTAERLLADPAPAHDRSK